MECGVQLHVTLQGGLGVYTPPFLFYVIWYTHCAYLREKIYRKSIAQIELNVVTSLTQKLPFFVMLCYVQLLIND